MAFYPQQGRDENHEMQELHQPSSSHEWLSDSDSSEASVVKVSPPSSFSEQGSHDMVVCGEESVSVSSWSDHDDGSSEEIHDQHEFIKNDAVYDRSIDYDHNKKPSQDAMSDMHHISESSDSSFEEQRANPNHMHCVDIENCVEIPNMNHLRAACSFSEDGENDHQSRIQNQNLELSEDPQISDDFSNTDQSKTRLSAFDDDLEKGCCPAPSFKQLDEHEEVTGDCCRVCYLAVDKNSMSGEVIKLGCACKDDLAVAHRHCAEAWFKIKGDRICEICGSIASNIIGNEEVHFIEQWNDFERNSGITNVAERFWQNQPLCNSLLACLILVLILSWLFRVTLS